MGVGDGWLVAGRGRFIPLAAVSSCGGSQRVRPPRTMEADAGRDELFKMQRRAVAVQLYTQQLGVAHLRSKAVAALGAAAINLRDQDAALSKQRAAAGPTGPAASLTSADQSLRIVYGAEALSGGLQGQQQQQQPDKKARQRRHRPVAVEIPGFSPRRGAGGSGARAGQKSAEASGASAEPDRPPPPGWVRVNADGEEIEAAPADADDFVMEAADDAVFDEEEWV